MVLSSFKWLTVKQRGSRRNFRWFADIVHEESMIAASDSDRTIWEQSTTATRMGLGVDPVELGYGNKDSSGSTGRTSSPLSSHPDRPMVGHSVVKCIYFPLCFH